MTGSEITELSMAYMKLHYPELVEHYDDYVHWWPGFGEDSLGQPGFDPDERDLLNAMNEMRQDLARHFGDHTMFGDITYEDAKAALGLETTEIPEVWKEGW